MQPTVNCAEACVNGCVLGEACPHREYLAAALKYVAETPLDRMVELAQASAPQRMLRHLEKGHWPTFPSR